mmetsp:Transcript_3692/g.10714  ORF Transcript_3692/g.10714 Transcript_3692/m.10714 type:complete len:242 (+) Transcript_3692:104-829(+)
MSSNSGPGRAAGAVAEVVRKRISVRQFDRSREVPLATVRELLEAASFAPSGGNTQPWHCYVVAGDARNALVDKVREVMEGGHLNDPPEFSIYPSSKAAPEYLARRRKLARDMYALMGVERDDQGARMEAMRKNFEFFDAPVGIMVTVDRVADRNGWGHVGMFLQSLCLLAEERGLATCLQEAWSTQHEAVYEALGVPREREVLWCGVALGFADERAAVNQLRSERLPVDHFASFRGFGPRL